MSVNNFDVLKEMGNRNLDIRGFPLFQNLERANFGKKNGHITITVNPETVKDIMLKKPLVGMLIVADKEQFDALKAELEAQQ
jgi:hypothetical protein